MRSKKAKCEIFAIFNRFDSVFVLLIFFLRLMSHFSIVNPSKSPNPILKYGKGRVQKNPSKYGLFPKGGGGSGGSQLESYGSENSHGKMLKIFGVTVWLTEFC